MAAPFSHPTANLIPTVVDPSSQELIPRGRVKDPRALVSAYQTLFNADRESSRQRAMVQAQVDGQPPYSEAQERMRGLAGRANVNWGLADQGLSEAVLPYNDILDAIDVFGQVPTNHGDEQMQERWGAIISEEITRMIRKWRRFDARWQQTNLLFNQEGVAFAFFDDDTDWRWRVRGQQFFKFPRRIEADVEACDIFTAQVDYLPHELFTKIRNPEVAREVGWNPEAVTAALKTACPHNIRTDDPQEWEKAWKDNDIIFGVTAATVQTVQGWVRELDGTVSHYIARADGEGDWLYKKEGKYRSMSSTIIAYICGIGTNGDFQSIRGWNQKSFSSSSAINRMLCKMMDGVVHVMTPVLTTDNEDSLMDQAIQPWGPYMKMDSGVKFAEQKMPNFDQTAIPALDQLQTIFRMRSQSYAPVPAAQFDRTQKTKYEVQTKTEQSGRLTSGSMNLFFQAWGDHFKEVVRRVCDPNYTQEDPGGHEVWQMRMRCLKRGVPLEAIYDVDVDRIEVNMGFGKGSVSERRSVVGYLNDTMYYRLDAYGQKVLNNMTVASYAGTRIANLLAPIDTERPPNDAIHQAISENNDASMGLPIRVLENDDHVAHLNTHLTRLFELNDGLTNLTIDLEQAIPQMMPIWEHSGEHMQYMDPMNPVSREFKEALQQLGEVITNGQKHLDAEAKRQQKEVGVEGGGEGSGENYGGTPASTYKQAVQAQSKLQELELDGAKQKQALAFDAAKRQQELAFRDLKFAQDIRQKRVSMMLDTQKKKNTPPSSDAA